MNEIDASNSNELLKLAVRKLLRKEIGKLSLNELVMLKIHDDCSDKQKLMSVLEPRPDETDLDRLERTYTLPKYTLAIHSAGLAKDKYTCNVGARIKEIRRLTKANRILSSTINGRIDSKTVYTKIETDNKEDFLKILKCDWPENSFECAEKPTVTREGLDFRLEIRNVDKDVKIEQHRESISDLKRQGLRNLRRATRYDVERMEEQKLNKIECNAVSLEVLRAVILDGVSIECTRRNHDVVPYIERVRPCKNCLDYGHGTKGCKSIPRCGKCGSSNHNVTLCPHKTAISCLHCQRPHEAGTPRCKRFFEENYKRNEFIIRFLIDECGAQSPFEVLGLPVPDGMNIEDDEILISSEEQTNDELRGEMVEWFEAYVQNKNFGISYPVMREEVDQLKKLSEEQSIKISLIEKDMRDVKAELSVKIEQVTENFNEKIENVHEHLVDLKQGFHTELIRIKEVLQNELIQTNKNISQSFKDHSKETKQQMHKFEQHIIEANDKSTKEMRELKELLIKSISSQGLQSTKD